MSDTPTINERAESLVRVALRRMAEDETLTPLAAVQEFDTSASVRAVALGIIEDELGIGGGPNA